MYPIQKTWYSLVEEDKSPNAKKFQYYLGKIILKTFCLKNTNLVVAKNENPIFPFFINIIVFILV